MNMPTRTELEEQYASMEAGEFTSLNRANLTEEAKATYDKEAERRKTPEWLKAEAQREQDLLRREGIENQRKLYYRSCNVDGVASLLILGVAVIVIMMFVFEKDELKRVIGIGDRPLLLTLLAFYFVAIVGIILRTNWGRILGIIVCCLALLKFPFGTVVGLVGLFAFVKGKNLFGPGRPKHADLKKEFHRIRQLEKANK